MFTNFYKKIYLISIILIFLLGVILRACAFVSYRSLWRDECSLALNIYFRDFSDLWGVLYHIQSAPPLFMISCKLFNLINPLYPEYFLRLFPFICGLLSLYLFFLVTKSFYESKLALVIANFLFAINTQLIYYSQEFKQYSTDVMVTLGCILYLSKLNISELTIKQALLNSLLIAILPLLSLPSLFVIASWFIIQICNKVKIKKITLIFLPVFFINLLYYIFILKPSQDLMLDSYNFFWKKGFLAFDIDSINYIISSNFSFYFQQSSYVFVLFLLFITGIIFIFRRRKTVDNLIIMILFIAIVVSFLSIYPLLERVSLYLLPIAILLIIIPLNFCKFKWLKIIYMVLLSLILFDKNNYHYNSINNDESAPYMLEMLKSNYQDNDFVIYNDVSDSQYEIYSYLYKFRIPNNRLGCIQLADYGEDWYYSVLDTLPKGHRYWFFYAYDIATKPVIPFLKKWAHKNGQVLFEISPNEKSYLLYLQL